LPRGIPGEASALFFGVFLMFNCAHGKSPPQVIDFAALNSNNIWRAHGRKKLYIIRKDHYFKERNGNSYIGL
jgi:hypothetical protein